MSKPTLHPTLYSPATTDPVSLVEKVLYNRNLPVWRLVICTEDSIRETDIPVAIKNIKQTLTLLQPSSRKTVFVRVRNHEVLKSILELPDASKLTGFVIPKADPSTFPAYARAIHQRPEGKFRIMPILESPQMTDRHYRDALRHVLIDQRKHIDCVRIGANDLMGHLGIRRDTSHLTVYDTPVGQTIMSIINEFRGSSGFTITAPVFECFDKRYDDLLRREVHQHIINGLFGQTVIHPRHLRIIRDMYSVTPDELESAQGILAAEAAAVKGVAGRMDEYTTHHKWARIILDRQSLFGSTDAAELRLATTSRAA
jgi:citrate lyase beta subunit